MLFEIKSYLKFLAASTNQHGVHSPFVFDLVTKCLYDRQHYPQYEQLHSFRKELLRNQDHIQVTDFGAGSRVFTSSTRKISAIAANAGISDKRARLLLRLVRYLQPDAVLEIGTSVGLATAALALGNPGAKITTLEGCPQTAAVAKTQFGRFGFNSIRMIIGEFSATLDALVPTPPTDFPVAAAEERAPSVPGNLQGALHESSQSPNATFDLIYFDGNHSKAATLAYFERLLPTITEGTVWIFDDIHWSRDMEEAWAEIVKNPKVTVTIDTFQWGLVFFRSGQEKEHFTIRV